MKHVYRIVAIIVFLFILGDRCFAGEVTFGEYRISGPFSHKNISVYIFRSDKATSEEKLITLEEGLKSKSVTVFETGSVSELAIENTSDYPVFIQAGDIVKGGRQDRLLRNDVVLEPRSGRLPIASLCVESGRWSGRGAEDNTRFDVSEVMISSRKLKLASKLRGDQNKVWSEVQELQDELSIAACMEIPKSQLSASSLQLTLEHKAVDSLTSEYVEALAPLALRFRDAVGFAYAINGAVNNADIYRSGALFSKLWPKLIKAASVEAAAGARDGDTTSVTLADIVIWLDTADNARALDKSVASNFQLRLKEREDNVVFETLDASGKLIHKNVIKR
jgi:ARG and Rhodanese-Phosphatase-superfamily-associated Protein domain